MATIIGISGSLRRGSFNSLLLRAAAELAPAGTTIELGSIDGIPLYNFDVEDEQGIPAPVAALKDRIIAADGLLIVSPEYNGSMPGVLKNAIDWLSRPPADIAKVFRSRPVGIIGVTPGLGGTNMAQTGWLAVLRTLGTSPWFGARVTLAKAKELFDAEGRLTDDTARQQLQAYLTGFAAFVDASARSK